MKSDSWNNVITILTVFLVFFAAALVLVLNDRARKVDDLAVVSAALSNLSRQEVDRAIPPPAAFPPELMEPDPDPVCQDCAAMNDREPHYLIVKLGLDIIRLGGENVDLKEMLAKAKRHLGVHHADVENLSLWLRSSQLETARLRDLNDELRGYTGGP